MIAAGIAVAAVGIAGRLALRHGRRVAETVKKQLDALPTGSVSEDGFCSTPIVMVQ